MKPRKVICTVLFFNDGTMRINELHSLIKYEIDMNVFNAIIAKFYFGTEENPIFPIKTKK